MEQLIYALWAAASVFWTVVFWGNVLIRRSAAARALREGQRAMDLGLEYVPPPA